MYGRDHDFEEDVLLACRRNIGDPPRRFPLWTRYGYLAIPQPRWAYRPEEALAHFFAGRNRLLSNGILRWGHVIQANQLLWRPGGPNCPGEVLYSVDAVPVPRTDFAAVARNLYELKGTAPDSEDLAGIAEYLTNERIRVFGLPVPPSLARGHNLAISTIYFARHHLPVPYLRDSWFPIVVNPSPPHIAMVLPSRHWPDPLVQLWKQ